MWKTAAGASADQRYIPLQPTKDAGPKCLLIHGQGVAVVV
jgi:hypothetical protein